jgi:ubiquinone/menaquinone biosynthesis C-methylase UbiE
MLARKMDPDAHVFIGLDIDRQVLAKNTLPWHLIQGSGERLPLTDGSCDIVVSGVALPLMNIPITLREIHRILKPGGSVTMSVHPFKFTKSELKRSFPKVIPSAYRLYVMANGLLFHLTGKLASFPTSESWQTEKSMRRALSKTGFNEIKFTYPDGKFMVEARKLSVSSST